MTQKNRTDLHTEINSDINDNSTGEITPADIRNALTDISDSSFNLISDKLNLANAVSGILPVANGGTGSSTAATYTSNQILIGNGTTTPAQDSNLTYTAFTLAAPFINSSQYTGTWAGNAITTLYGGTGFSSYTQGAILYASSGIALAKLAKSTAATRYLSNTGTSNNPAWAQINLTNGVTGVLPVANGGTGTTAGAVLSVVAGSNITVDNTDPLNPIVSASGIAGSGGAPGGASNSIQFNNSGAFDGFGTWDGTLLSVPGDQYISGTFKSSYGITSIDTNSRTLNDGMGVVAIDYSNRILNSTAYSGSPPLFDWSVSSSNPSGARYWFQDDSVGGIKLIGDGSGLSGISASSASYAIYLDYSGNQFGWNASNAWQPLSGDYNISSHSGSAYINDSGIYGDGANITNINASHVNGLAVTAGYATSLYSYNAATPTNTGNISLGDHAGGGSGGSYNLCLVDQAGYYLTGNRNLIAGFGSGYLTTGDDNVFWGHSVAPYNNSGSFNIAIGSGCYDGTTATSCIVIGRQLQLPLNTTTNGQMTIGNMIFANDVDGTGSTISTGKVGIKVKSPLYDLDVLGNIHASTGLYQGGVPFGISQALSNSSIIPIADGTYYFDCSNSGRVTSLTFTSGIATGVTTL